MAIQSSFPSIKPSLLLDFANSKALDPRITFTRASSATFYDFRGVLQTAAAGVPRFDHDPVTGESLGLLIEEQRTNLVLRSEEFDDAAWSQSNVSVTADTVVAPDGTLTGDSLADDATNGQHRVATAIITAAPTTTSVTLTVYVKNNNQSNLFFLSAAGDNLSTTYGRFASTFNLSTGVVAGNNNVNGATFISNSITPVGNGWYRCSITGTIGSTASPTGVRMVVGFANNTNVTLPSTYVGTGESVFIWGAQLEVGAFPTSYIPTTSATVTRAADAASMTGTNFSTWYRADEGTLYGETTFIGSDIRQLVHISDGSINNDIGINSTSTATNPRLRINVNSVSEAETSVALAANTFFKAAGAYKTNDVNIAVNGTAATTDTTSALPVVDRLFIGSRADGSRRLNTTIRKIAYYPIRLPNATLQALTS